MEQTSAPLRRLPLRLAAAFGGTLLVLFCLLLGAYALPGGPVRAHLAESAALLEQEGLYPQRLGSKLTQGDNYTDTLMLFAAATADELPPLQAMMTNTVYNVDNFTTLPQDLQCYLAGDTAALRPFAYARYWHGYLIWLRPLLLFLTLDGVRAVQYAVWVVLLVTVIRYLWTVCGARSTVWFGLSQLVCTVFLAPMNLQFFTCFMLAYAGCLWVLCAPRRSDQLALCMMVLGVCTSFCDLLVTPIVVVGLPLAVWLLRPEQRLRGGVAQCGAVAAQAMVWGFGYAACWAMKWVLATFITGQNVMQDALHQAQVRTVANTWHGMELTWGNITRFVYNVLAQRGLFWPLVLLAVLAVAVFVLCLRSRAALVRALPLGLVALFAPAWFVVLRTHSIQHGWFTWRGACVTLFAGMAFVYYACSLRTGLRRLKGKLCKH